MTTDAERSTGSEPRRDERLWAAVAHAGPLLGAGILMPFLPPIVVYLAKKDDSRFIADQALESINFQVSLLIAIAVTLPTWCIGIGWILAWAIGIYGVVMCLVGAIRAFDGRRYRYPVNLRLI